MRVKKINKNRLSQTGSALAIAVFIIVVMALLAAGISKSISSSSEQTVYEVYGTRALFAAESANERMLALIFPISIDGSDDAACVSSQTTEFAQSGLVNCVATTDCTLNEPLDSNTQYYRIVSTGVCKTYEPTDFSCGNEKICASRTIEVEAKAL
jgi:MSHA biogenesis protein MshP